jgi:hypothetical protein
VQHLRDKDSLGGGPYLWGADGQDRSGTYGRINAVVARAMVCFEIDHAQDHVPVAVEPVMVAHIAAMIGSPQDLRCQNMPQVGGLIDEVSS